MAYHSQEELEAFGFAKLGRNVWISTKASIYDAEKIEIGDNSRIDDFAVVSGRVTLGRFVYIGPLCLVAGGKPGVFMDDFVTLAYHAQAFSQSDDYNGATMTNPTVPRRFKNERMAAVHLQRHCIVGAGAIVMPGVTLGEGTSVGALSLVLKPTEEWSIYAGAPAKRLRARERGLLELEKEFWREIARDGLPA